MMNNHDDLIHLGDVRGVLDKIVSHKDIDVIFCGSPCQGFSVAGKQLNFEHELSFNADFSHNETIQVMDVFQQLDRAVYNILQNCLIMKHFLCKPASLQSFSKKISQQMSFLFTKVFCTGNSEIREYSGK